MRAIRDWRGERREWQGDYREWQGNYRLGLVILGLIAVLVIIFLANWIDGGCWSMGSRQACVESQETLQP